MAARRTIPHILGLAALLLGLAATAVDAEPLRVSGQADAGAHAVQARQQALERAFVEAVMQEAQRLLPGPLPESRLNALRQHLAPRAVDFILSYQEAAASKPDKPDKPDEPGQPGHSAQPPLELTLDAEVNGRALRPELVRLGLFAGAGHPRFFSVRFGPGVSERDFKALDGQQVLLGLSRAGQAAVDLSLERLPQGYYKAVLRHAGQSLAADAGDLSALWLEVWGRYFASQERQSAGSAGLTARGFASVDGVHELSRLLSGWDDAAQGALLSVVELKDGDIRARWSLRVVSGTRLDAHLREYLPGRGLTVVLDGAPNGRQAP